MTLNKRLIAITGGIGSGKSTVTEFFKKKGKKCFSCDQINSELLRDANYLAKLQFIFPSAFQNGVFSREALGKIIFSDEKQRERLNQFSHKEILIRLLQNIEKSSETVIFVEVPLLAGSGFEKYFPEIIVVTASDKIRAERICKRDGIDKKFALLKIASQNNTPTFDGATVYTVKNDKTTKELNEKLSDLYSKIFP